MMMTEEMINRNNPVYIQPPLFEVDRANLEGGAQVNPEGVVVAPVERYVEGGAQVNPEGVVVAPVERYVEGLTNITRAGLDSMISRPVA